MRIEEVTRTSLSKAPDKELLILRLRFIQLWNKNFKGNNKAVVGSLNRSSFLSKYRLLLNEYNRRKLEHSTEDIDRAAFKKAMEIVKLGIDTTNLGEIVVVPDYVSLGGSAVNNMEKAGDVDIILRENESRRDTGLELKLVRILDKQKNVASKEKEFIYSERGPHSTYIPLYDLVLRPKEDSQKVEVKEDYRKSAETERAYYEGLDTWSKDFEAEYRELTKYLVGDTVLSLGCGSGRLEKRLSSIYRVKGIDNNKTALDMCKSKGLRVDNVDLEKKEIPYDDNIFDNVIGVHFLEHVANTNDVIGEAVRVAKKRAIFIVPLGERQDPTHKQIYKDIPDFKKQVVSEIGVPDNSIKLHKISGGDNSAILVLELDKLQKSRHRRDQCMSCSAKPTIECLWAEGNGHAWFCKNCFKKWATKGDGAGEIISVKEIQGEASKNFADNTSPNIKDKFEFLKSVLKPFGKYTPPKPTMANITEAFRFEDIADWIKDKWPVDVEEKLNGFRCIAEKSGDKLRIWSEGRQDRTKAFQDLTDVLSKVNEDFILDFNLGIDRKGKPLPRIKLMTLMADKPVFEEGDVIKATCFDLPYWSEDLHEKPLKDRRKKLEEFYNKYLKGSDNFALTNFVVAHNQKELERAFNKLSKLPQSEGVVIKALDSIWDTDGSNEGWSKIKLEAEIKVIVFERNTTKKGDAYNYHCGVLLGDTDYTNTIKFRGKTYVDFGNTFNTKIEAQPGDILTIGIEEIIPDEKNNKLQWLGPRVIDIDKDRKEPYYANQVVAIASRGNILQKKVEGNIDYEVGDTGRGVLQLHIMGIEEKYLDDLKKVASEAYASRHNYRKLRMLLKGAIGEQAAHLDLRLARKGDKYFEGGEIMIGNLTGLSKLDKFLNEPNAKLRFGWKTPHAEEPTAETIRGPVSWMDAGSKRLEIFEPGEVGAFANTYAAMLQLDDFSFKVTQADRHAKKMVFANCKMLKDGEYLFAYVPVGEGRVWMISRLKSEEKKFEKYVPFFVQKSDERIVCGIVYEPDEVDSQGDMTTEDEIRKAAYQFMEEVQKFKMNHKGKPVKARVLESYIAPNDLVIAGHEVKKGSWLLTTRILDKQIWDDIKSGKLTGYSMAGYARTE